MLKLLLTFSNDHAQYFGLRASGFGLRASGFGRNYSINLYPNNNNGINDRRADGLILHGVFLHTKIFYSKGVN